ncbi:hypothetical protein, partial [Burkholderia gladioli]|uniref:hypothetical protein n=1 Tax=Burkholderia gladioli TaxID=28095 RepID=UPI001ABA6461
MPLLTPVERLATLETFPATPDESDASELPVLVDRLESAVLVSTRPVDSEDSDCAEVVESEARPVDRLVMPVALSATLVASDVWDWLL